MSPSPVRKVRIVDAQAVNSALERYFEQTPIPVVCAYLYGSFARGEQRAQSDVDVAVLLPATADRTLIGPLTTFAG